MPVHCWASARLCGRACARHCWSCINHTSACTGNGNFLACAAREVVTRLCRWPCWQEVLSLCRSNVPSLPCSWIGLVREKGGITSLQVDMINSGFKDVCQPLLVTPFAKAKANFGFFMFWLGFVSAFFWSPVQCGSSKGCKSSRLNLLTRQFLCSLFQYMSLYQRAGESLVLHKSPLTGVGAWAAGMVFAATLPPQPAPLPRLVCLEQGVSSTGLCHSSGCSWLLLLKN